VLNTEVAVYSADGETRTGRVAASEGTKISAAGDLQMTFDGRFLPVSPGSGIYSRTYAREGEQLPIKLKEGRVFMLGDSRESAIDSRTFGPIARKNIKGRVVAVFRIRQI
jgi:signal peptidase I